MKIKQQFFSLSAVLETIGEFKNFFAFETIYSRIFEVREYEKLEVLELSFMKNVLSLNFPFYEKVVIIELSFMSNL